MTTAEIKQQLLETTEWQPWMTALEQDSRKSVRQLLKSWQKRRAKLDEFHRNHQEKQRFDQFYRQTYQGTVAGTDEAGRGPLAGPLVTAAVVLPEECPELIGLNDSKQLSREQRESFEVLVKKSALGFSVHITPPEIIDELNIYQATRQSMTEAVRSLGIRPAVVLADAMRLDVPMPCEPIVKGDTQSLAIAAASVLAKTERDRLMRSYAAVYPGYGFEQNAGYGTAVHLAALEHQGVTPIHRRTFEPVKSMLENR
ncbi:ribonuclease HII [Planococcus lenghuensis]|uniref:Ribonuclease HII n=1 Tax=Planococcus lenghuensis TaxID=2213202 RepID=A0A1Q2L1I1_9BACL|nr:ribonuclease HII [Planococcus lenghuensis]AQQ53742.1 ribonuclease HII [Planococcus lenghuensis]